MSIQNKSVATISKFQSETNENKDALRSILIPHLFATSILFPVFL